LCDEASFFFQILFFYPLSLSLVCSVYIREKNKKIPWAALTIEINVVTRMKKSWKKKENLRLMLPAFLLTSQQSNKQRLISKVLQPLASHRIAT
jgi:hypothetical protein